MPQEEKSRLLNLCLMLPLALLCLSSCTGRSSYDATAKRNAMNITSISASALAAGHDFASGLTDPELIAIEVGKGHTIRDPSSPFDGAYFGAPLSNAEIYEASRFIEYDYSTNLIVYTSTPTRPPSRKIKEQQQQMKMMALGMGCLLFLVFIVAAIIRFKNENVNPEKYL